MRSAEPGCGGGWRTTVFAGGGRIGTEAETNAGEDARILVRLVADPGGPTQLAHEMAELLPEKLALQFGDSVRWDFEAASEPFTTGTEDLSTLLQRIVTEPNAADGMSRSV